MFEIETFLRYKKLELGELFSAEILRLIKKGDVKSPEIDVVAKRLVGKFEDFAKTFSENLLLIINMAYTIDCLKRKRFGLNHPTNITNAIVGCFIGEISKSVHVEKTDLEKLDLLIATLDVFGGDRGWFVPKLLIFKHLLVARKNATNWIKEFELPGSESALELIRKRMPSLDDDIQQVMQGIAELRKYGVKTCYFQDGISHKDAEAWFFLDAYEINSRLPKSMFHAAEEKSLAFIVMGDKPQHETLLTVESEQTQNDSWKAHHVSLPSYGKFGWFMDYTGEMWIRNGYSSLPVREIFSRHGKQAEYEMLRLAHAVKLYDLVVPLTVVSTMPELPVQKTGVAKVLEKISGGRLLTPELIIPRVRRLDSLASIIDELRNEVEQAEQETKRRATREHPVTHFVRPLPKGHKHSKEARELALEFNIVLADNETFVKDHKRGKGEQVATPKARQRRK